jgi:hypothetical protein
MNPWASEIQAAVPPIASRANCDMTRNSPPQSVAGWMRFSVYLERGYQDQTPVGHRLPPENHGRAEQHREHNQPDAGSGADRVRVRAR